MHRSTIEWTDYSGGYANVVWRGAWNRDCKVSPGCAHCYVDRAIVRRGAAWPQHTTFYQEKLARLARCRPRPNGVPYRRGRGARPMVFLCDTGDLFHEALGYPEIFSVLNMCWRRSDVDWQLLTKRARRMFEVMAVWMQERGLSEVPPWMWLMVSAENQVWYDLRTHWLEQIPAAVRGVSLEPLLGAVDLRLDEWGESLNWFIAGGESGAGARPVELSWMRGLRDQCVAATKPFFFKAWGDSPDEDAFVLGNAQRVRRGGRLLDGKLWEEFPRGVGDGRL